MKPIDFDLWCELARNDPEAFERKRRQVVEAVIDDMPATRQIRMRRLQWRIERVCARADNPIAASMALSSMMWDSLICQRDLLTSFSAGYGTADLPTAQVLPLYCPLG